ncbi:luciferase family protein [Gaiella sp.]|uniref:luciferase domain-containing protein n=1 Tax=Gaiella sp. TaxID=2663207 RepID=UPI0039834200
MAQGAHDRIVGEVAAWDGVATGSGRFGSTQFLVGRRELGHLHGDALLDVPLPRTLQAELLASGRVETHEWVPDSGWSSRRLTTDADVVDAIAILRLQWERASGSAARRDDEPSEAESALG